MILKGIVEETFGGRTIFRGFATLRSLSTLSKPEYYQRRVDEYRIDKIVEFLKNGTFRFFPELIFSLQFRDNSAISKIKGTLLQGNETLEDGVKIKKGKFLFQPTIGDNPTTKVMSIEFPIVDGNKFLSRIDGNHRLSAIDKILCMDDINQDVIALKQLIGDLVVPFSILLQQQTNDSTKHEAAFYYLINSKSIPLTTEENIKTILGSDLFIDSEKIELIGDFALDIEMIVSTINQFPNIISVVGNGIYDFFVNLFKLSLTEKPSIDKISAAMRYIDIQYYENSKLRSNPNVNILLSLLYYRLKNEANYGKFQKWIISNDLFEIKEVPVRCIIEIFEKTHKKGPYKVFVAMPYVSHKHVNEFNTLFREVLKDIQEKENVAVELIPIMRFKGASQRIDQRLIEKIKECDIFIADLTSCNDNVIYEIGLAEGNNKPMILLKSDTDYAKVPFEGINRDVMIKDKIPFDMDKLQYIPYDGTGYYNDIKSIVRNNLTAILQQKYEMQ